MKIIIDVPSDLENKLIEKCDKVGVSPSEFVYLLYLSFCKNTTLLKNRQILMEIPRPYHISQLACFPSLMGCQL